MKQATRRLERRYRTSHSPTDYSAWRRELDSQRSLFQTKYAEYTGDQLSQNPDMTPEHCGRGSTACYRRLQRPPLPFTRQMTLSLISGGKSRIFGPLRQLLQHLTFRSYLPAVFVTSPWWAALKSPKSSQVCHLKPAPLIRCPHGWLRRYKTFWFLSSVTCAMRPSVLPFSSQSQASHRTSSAEEKYSGPWSSDIL